MGLILLVYLVITTIITVANSIHLQNESSRLSKSIFYPKSKTQSTVNHYSTGLQNSFGVSGNVGIGIHFGGGYRIKNSNGKDDQLIVHNKMYDKYLGTSFGFGSLGSINKGHVNDVEQSNEDQNGIFQDESDQDSNNETISTITEKPKPGVFRKISDYWSGEHTEPKGDYTNNGIFKWNIQKFKNKNNIGTPR